MENGNNFSPADLAALGGMGGLNNDFFWIFALLILAGGGFGGNGLFGNSQSLTDAIISTNGGYATQQSVGDQFNFAALERQNNEIVASVNQAKYDNINVMKDIQSQLQLQLSNLGTMEQAIGDKVQQCCCDTNRNIEYIIETTAIIMGSKYASTHAPLRSES